VVRGVVGDGDSLGAFSRLEGRQERGQEGMCLTTMVDLHWVSFRVEEEQGAETVEGSGGDETCVSKEEGRGRDSMEGKRVGDAVAQLRPLGGHDVLRGGR
jgi:hypothetical protein